MVYFCLWVHNENIQWCNHFPHTDLVYAWYTCRINTVPNFNSPTSCCQITVMGLIRDIAYGCIIHKGWLLPCGQLLINSRLTAVEQPSNDQQTTVKKQTNLWQTTVKQSINAWLKMPCSQSAAHLQCCSCLIMIITQIFHTLFTYATLPLKATSYQ